MPDNDRLDLSGDLDKLTNDLMKDVKAAASEVKERKAKIAAEDARDVQKIQSRKTQTILVAVGAVVILLLSYWLVFARPSDTPTSGPKTGPSPYASNVRASQKTAIGNPGATRGTTTTRPMGLSGGGAVGQGSQVTEHPNDDYEKPSEGDQGM